MRYLPFKFMKPKSNLEFKLKSSKAIKERFEEKTTKLLNMTNKLMERNETNFIQSVENLKESVEISNQRSAEFLQSVRPLKHKLEKLKSQKLL